jgi:signal transduction histidine kinase
MRLRALVEATTGRRLLLRIWMHGVLLFVGVIAIVFVGPLVVPKQDAVMAARSHPEFTLGLAERALALRGDRLTLAAEIARLADRTSVQIGVFSATGAPLTASDVRGATPAELAELVRPASYVQRASAEGERLVVGAYRGAQLEAYAVVITPPIASISLRALVLLLAALVLALLVVAVPLTRSIVRPLERLGALSRELGDGNLGVRAPTDRRDEIGDLARSFNRMAIQIRRLRAAERELLADVSHELRTPLARMRVVLDLASDADADPVAVRRYVREITTDLSELDQLIDHIITSSRLDPDGRWDEARPPLHRTSVELGELVDATKVRFGERWPGRTIASTGYDQPLMVDADPVMLRRALDNLVDNARKYSPDDAPIVVAVSRAELNGRAAAKLEVIDEGIGIDDDDQPNVFTAFFRADKSRTRTTGGVGLGLALTRRIVEAHQGTVGFTSERDRGSRFWLVLPLAPS